MKTSILALGRKACFVLAPAACLALAGTAGLAQTTVPSAAAAPEVGYRQPSASARAVLDAPALPQHQMSPDQSTLAIVGLRRHRPLADLARPVTRLAGERLDAVARGPHLISPIESITLKTLADGRERAMTLPAGGGFHSLRWSPGGHWLLLQRRTDAGTELWVSEVARPALRRLSGLRLNLLLERDFAWLGPDELLVPTVPDTLGAPPAAALPAGPTVQESFGRTSPERTLQNLLTNRQDEALFSHLATSQLRRVNLASGAQSAIGSPGLLSRVEAVGDGTVLLVERLATPFSYQVDWEDFAREVQLIDADSGRVLRELPGVRLKEGVPVQGVVTGARQFWTSPHGDGAVLWVEALDGGDPRTQVPHRDRVLRLDPPYLGEAKEVHRSAQRLVAWNWLETRERVLVTEFDRDRVWVRSEILALDGSAAPLRLQDRSWRDRYADPGTPLRRVLPSSGRSVVRVDNGALWLAGAGASPSGDRPFLDRWELATRKPVRVFQAGESHFERVFALLGNAAASEPPRIVTSRESLAEPPNLVLRSADGMARMQPLTAHADPTPSLRGIQRERVRFKRADGVDLSFWLYLPPGHKGKNAGDARPTFVWAYPEEFTDSSVAGQVSGSRNRFLSFGATNPLMLLLEGYVVLMDATMPVVGDPKTVNDSFIEQIGANARAIVEQAVALGVTQRDKVVVGGHSYGAFMVANLLAHTDLFKAGVARSGAYNRTLTPFGFQAERRTLWEAPNSYLKLSPFLAADRIKAPVLLIHGESDDNPGTFPMQSQRLYQALAGTGGNVRYVSLPFEGHGYSARESQGHVLWEMADWMRRHVGPGVAP